MKNTLSKLILGSCFISSSFAGTMNLSNTPLFLTESVAPLTMLIVSRDHKLYFEAYNDATDLDGDGELELGFKPSIDYFGYFDSYKCYSYDTARAHFFPISISSTKTCSGAWSGNFLNYLTTARFDALRKVLYGGLRSTDSTTETVIRRTFIPQDGHTWGKEYTDSVTNGYNISDYTPYSTPTSGRHLFANVSLNQANSSPLLRVALNQPYRIWEWVSIEAPVAGSRALQGRSGPLINGITDFVVQVKVCDESIGVEDNCKKYPNGAYKPVGLLQEFGENDSMSFGLMTGSYKNNLNGGVVRKNISSFTNEVNPTTGQFTTVNGIVSTLNRLTVTGFQSNFLYNCGWITTRNMNNDECNMWGNPIAEIMYEAVRYYAGKKTPTANFNYSSGEDTSLGLPKPGWIDPYTSFPYCAKANMLVISDLYPSYDGGNVPGSSFSSASSDLSPTINATDLGQTIFNGEGLSNLSAFIGQAGDIADGAPTAKNVTSFGNIRGLAPQETNSLGTYYSAAVAYYGWLNDVNLAPGKQNIKTYVVALSSPAPEISFNVAGKKVTIIPFGKSVKGSNINRTQGAYQPNNNIVDFYIQEITPNSAKFSVNFEDVQQGADFDMDAIVEYNVNIVDNNITISLSSLYGASIMTQHMGYIISGTNADGVYLEVRDTDTSEGEDVDYFLDTPPGALPGANWQDRKALPLRTSRTFTVGQGSNAVLLKSPLWYAAKWGGFDDNNKNNIPDNSKEYTSNLALDPDNYFLVTNANNLKNMLKKALASILDQSGSFASAALNAGSLADETRLYQAIFKTKDWSGQLLSFNIDKNNGDIISNGTSAYGAQWDAAEQLSTQNYLTGRQIISYNPVSKKGIAFRWPQNSNNPSDNELSVQQIAALNLNPNSTINDSNGKLRLEYLRGNINLEEKNGGTMRDRSTKLGDIINSNPIVVNVPEQKYPLYWGENAAENSKSYVSFRQSKLNRAPVVYVGANDGMLHGFDATTGKELLAYVPAAIYKNLNNLSDPKYVHRYYVDGSPTVIDAFIQGDWHTVLVSGLGGGGQGVFALDITNPAAYSENSANNLVLWEFSDLDDKDLGYTYSQPSIARLANGDWAAIFGNGYNNTEADSNTSETGNAVLYIVNLSTGALIKKFDTEAGMSSDPLSSGRPNGMSSPTVVDIDNNGVAEYIYVGDLFGNLWKIDISSANQQQWDFSFKQAGKPAPLFIARDNNGNRQAITTKPAVSHLKNNYNALQIYIGTGKYIELDDKFSKRTQSIYALKDDSGTRINGRTALRQQTIIAQPDGNTRVTSDNIPANNERGWYMDLIFNSTPLGERIISNLIYMNEKIIFTTVTPSQDPCEYGGESWIMELNAYTGARLNYPVFDLDKDGSFNQRDLVTYKSNDRDLTVAPTGLKASVGLIPTPAILNAGGSEYKYLPGTSGGIQKVGENPGNQQFGRQSWKQLK